jgi:hypothetical protein
MFLKRLLLGLLLGTVVGLGVAVAATRGLSLPFAGPPGAIFAYLGAAVTGTLTGLVAGKPIWHQTGKIEAGLKAFFGPLLAMGLLFVLRKFVHLNLDLSTVGAGKGAFGDLAYTALPAVSGLLGGFFELDNTPEAEGDGKASAKVRVAPGSKAAASEEDLDDEEEPAKQKRGK